MRKLSGAAKLGLLITAVWLLVCACSRSGQLPEHEAPQEASLQGLSLPSPAQIRQPAETQSEYLKAAIDYEAELPWHNIGLHEEQLRFIPAKTDPLAYALYWLKVPGSPTAPTVQFDPGFDPQQAWLGIANFSSNRWDFGRAEQLQYGSGHVQAGFILVAVVNEVYDELEWLIAGGMVPPFVESVSPAAFSLDSSSDFRVAFTDDKAASYDWQFGGGLSISQSGQASPKFIVTALGDFSGTLSVANAAGSTTYDFDYTVVPAAEYEPLHLYAIPAKSTVSVGEEFTVSIRTGLIPQSQAAVTARVALLFPSDMQYVADSFNTGSTGGDKWDIDGFWALQPSEEAFFLTYPDSWLEEVPGPGAGKHHMEISLAAANLMPQYGSGVLCNLKLKCDRPGSYSLQLLEESEVTLTSFTTLRDEVLWHDLSNEGIPAITVVP